MTEPRDSQPDDPFGPPAAPPPPTSSDSPASPTVPDYPTSPPTADSPPTVPPASGAQPTGWRPEAGKQQEYFVHSPQSPVPFRDTPTSFQDAPDPFGGASAGGAPRSGRDGPQRVRSARLWVIPTAALLVLAVVATALYLFFASDGADENKAASTSPTTQSDGGRSETDSPDSASPDPDTSGPTGAATPIAGTFEVNGTVQSYSGPPIGQLGGAPKAPGSPAFSSPQTWVIADCTGVSCELTVEQGGMTVTLELADGTWSGQAATQIACKPTVNAISDATITIEIPEAGGTASRTLSAQCDEPIEEVDALTLIPQ